MWRTPRAAWLVVGLIVVVSAAIRFAVSTGVAAPWIAPDEIVYGLLGRSLYENGTLSILGDETPFFSLVYPALIGAPLALFDPATGVTLVQALQAIVMSLAAVVAYAWARELASAGWALGAAALVVAIPGIAYSGLLMTEAAFYPIATLALWLLSRMLARPTLGRQAAFWAAAALTIGTRLQATLLIPAAVVAIVLAALLQRRIGLLRSTAPSLGLAAVVLVGGIVATLTDRQVLGGYTGALEAGYDATAAVTGVAEHLGALGLIVAAVPLVALAALTADVVRRPEPSPELAALLATAIAWSVLLAVQVGVFASRFVDHLAERDLLTAAPPLFVVFATWCARGSPRPQPFTTIAALILAGLVVLLPLDRVATQEAALDSFSTIPLRLLAEASSPTTRDAIWAVAAVVVIALAVLLPRRRHAWLAVGVGAVLVASSIVVSAEVRDLSQADQRWWFADASPSWVDEAAAEGPVLFLQGDTDFWGGVWKQAFWNERIDAVARLRDGAVRGPVRSRVVAPRFDGLLLDEQGRRLEHDQVVVPRGMVLIGEALAGYGPSGDLPGLTLWRAERPVRVSMLATGVKPNGDLIGVARITVFDCGDGRLELTLLGKQGAPVRFRVDGVPAGETTPPPGSVWQGAVPSPGGTERCEFEIESPGLTGSTRIDYVRD